MSMSYFYRRREVAKLFGVHINTIDNWCKQGKLPFVKFGNNHSSLVRFPKIAIDNILKNGFNS